MPEILDNRMYMNNIVNNFIKQFNEHARYASSKGENNFSMKLDHHLHSDIKKKISEYYHISEKKVHQNVYYGRDIKIVGYYYYKYGFVPRSHKLKI